MLNNINASGSSIHKNRGLKRIQKTSKKDEPGESQTRDKVEIGAFKISSQKLLPAPPKRLALPSLPSPEKELTVLFYMNGQYDDIGGYTADAFLDLEKTGSDENINLIAQLGRYPHKPKEDDTSFHVPVDGDWTGVRRYKVTKDDHKDLEIPLSSYEKLESDMPDNPVLKFVIGSHHWENGDKVKANKYFDQAREKGMVDYMNNPDSEKNKVIKNEYNEKTKHIDESLVGKKIIKSKVLHRLDESTKMKEPETLQNFITWGMEKYPAKHYMLVVMGHGGAWMGASAMSPKRMGEAIETGVNDFKETTGREGKMDALVLNSCYMGNTEALNEMKGAADVTLASENYATTAVFDDWSQLIGGIKKDLENGKSFNGRDFASNTVEKYRADNLETKNNYPDFAPWNRSYLTLTAVDNKKMGALVKSWGDFNKECKKNGVAKSDLFKAVGNAKDYASGALVPRQVFSFYDQIRDMGDIMNKVKESDKFPAPVKKAAGNVKKAISDAIINEQHEGTGMEGSQGFTIWGPTNGIDVLFMKDSYQYDVPDFSEKTEWDSTLKAAFNDIPKPTVDKFLKNYKDIKKLKKDLKKEDIEEDEKKKLTEQMEKLQDDNVKLKKQMDFTVKRPKDIFKSAENEELPEVGDLFNEDIQKIPLNEAFSKKRVK